MSGLTSPDTGKAYGTKRTCRAFGVSRSSYYAWSKRKDPGRPLVPAQKRGPKTTLTDDELLTLVRDDLAVSPFSGEGHRKVWARLRVVKDVRVSRKRLLRVMREANLLSPRRRSQGPTKLHEGTITTQEPGVVWGTDGARILTADEGWVWSFFCVEHWNAECVGYHVTKRGTRFAALEPVAMALADLYGSVHADVARGLSLRLDHGCQYLADHFQKQIRYWGIAPSFAFVAEPQTNGVAERFIRTMKEQAVYGRVFRNAEEVRAAVAAFVETYNNEWRLEKLGFMTPREAREQFDRALAA
jgi:transposase InsO family protein